MHAKALFKLRDFLVFIYDIENSCLIHLITLFIFHTPHPQEIEPSILMMMNVMTVNEPSRITILLMPSLPMLGFCHHEFQSSISYLVGCDSRHNDYLAGSRAAFQDNNSKDAKKNWILTIINTCCLVILKGSVVVIISVLCVSR